MNDQQLLRYSRHILLDEIDIEGQSRLLAAHALVIGAGGLGSPAAMYLASAGIGRITLVDNDTVDLTNLQRQIMHTTGRVGQAKVESGREALRQINPDTEVVALAERTEGDRLRQLVEQADVVLDCSDNFATRHAVNRACVTAGVPLVSGAAIRFDGQVSVFDPRDDASPCYACLFPPDREFEEVQCSVMGVFSPLVGIIGAMQAAEALKLVAGVGRSLAGRLLILEAREMEWTSISVARDRNCPVCGKRHA
ncbi:MULTISPECIES: molybdopterin-synthase adenylyltransferase MoeB [unclassified Herbaspirillum]|uniref:HesA/MoeB/ThiF family protein n=1 Tax=unclassified Herbaspirillum TaxID=2624150 RepID=UPI001152573D|nr:MULTISPECIES: molybdopterin-synthase adenylyltransferase MoeB [unclassified Herbaspirillum]MBB5393678.1 molybdopterin/thiamine biosynthesis adenylyltransferase [Herbaspirillum sp. SJZ102]TQK01459.1 [sulfur carrier protein ThiS] adenylyltransferase [Herbaspirillum sp. SJZ130]TQK05855.1 [sulfur carrier protein ThiS] adenylyltransferase [Herbaspirillum sp. SJZ106]TWC65229.1 [sulfur carrier protein ThiS] adenylyltransferase [Herbaspirillum sp. SJZ099]